jgi:hypothetical protein
MAGVSENSAILNAKHGRFTNHVEKACHAEEAEGFAGGKSGFSRSLF